MRGEGRRSRAATPGSVALAWAASLGLGACARDADAPPTVAYGQAVCATCNMIVSEPRFASAVVAPTRRPDPLIFDDFGCLLDHPSTGSAAGSRIWVHDHETEAWLAAETAWYLRSPDVRTPMGSGVLAFRERATAERERSDRGGTVLGWKELCEANQRNPLVAPPPGSDAK
ncbi:MAG: nitrous oxide reductase accessory protein NosL [Gemmatimonadetes bacterium]|nr:nitrous oxide reductase accessory protein NosL [Gemmatimonadota bacterium]